MVIILDNHALSPSDATPHLTINHDIAKDLDSSNAFEGPEKLLEVWFCEAADRLPPSAQPDGLKAVPSKIWEDMLDLVSCKVLSVISSDHMDAYLLSESSMFVFPHKIILKTCGTTTLLLGLSRLLEIAAVYAGFVKGATELFAAPHRVFYSRKNFLFPDKQLGPHKSWQDECNHLDKLFSNGSAYLVGKMNGDHWYLYLTVPDSVLTPPMTPFGMDCASLLDDMQFEDPCMSSGPMVDAVPEDETLEILMTDLDPQTAQQFFLENAKAKLAEVPHLLDGTRINRTADTPDSSVDGDWCDQMLNEASVDVDSAASIDGESSEITTEGHILGTVISKTCGLSDVYSAEDYPDAKIDAYCFEPCGFSANAVIPASSSLAAGSGSNSGTQAHYFTVHVTPEPQCSYASFETNVPSSQTGRETRDVIEQVVNIFKPCRFSVTLFEATKTGDQYGSLETGSAFAAAATARGGGGATKRNIDHVKGYRRVDKIVHGFDGYDLIFRYFERKDWKGGASRLGEA